MNFFGDDWAELSKHFNLPDDGYFESSPLAEYLEENKQNANVEEACRKFLDALIVESDKINYMSPLWRGLAEIQDSFTFMDVFIQLLPHMWT